MQNGKENKLLGAGLLGFPVKSEINEWHFQFPFTNLFTRKKGTDFAAQGCSVPLERLPS